MRLFWLVLVALLVSVEGKAAGVWRFDEGTGTTSVDGSGQNHPATLVGGATWTNQPKAGPFAVQMNGSSNYVQVNNPQLPAGDFTISGWVRPVQNKWQAVFIALTPDAGPTGQGMGYELALTANGSIELWTSGVLRFTLAQTRVPLNAWTYLTLRRQGSNWKVYINGNPTNPIATDANTFAYASCPLYIGVDTDTGCTGAYNGHFNGRIDEVRLHDRALSDEEIRAEAGVINIGITAVFPEADSGNANMVLAQHTPVPQSCKLLDISFYVTTAGGQLYLGVYQDAGNTPGTLLATTAVFTPVANSWNRMMLSTQPQLPSGAPVWLTYAPANNALGFRKQAAGQGSRYFSRSSFGGLPTTFATTGVTTDPVQWSMWATCETGAGTPPPQPQLPAAPGVPTINFRKIGSLTFEWDYPTTEPVANFYLYYGIGASGCPSGPTSVQVAGSERSVTVSGLAAEPTWFGQVVAVNADSISECSNVASGIPK